MDQSILKATITLRDDAWRKVLSTEEFRAYKALNNAVKAMGGDSGAEFITHAAAVAAPTPRVISGSSVGGNAPFVRRVSQAEAAEQTLRETGAPLTGAQLVQPVAEKGAVVGGENPTTNLTSTLSRDKRFYNLRRDGQYFWWIRGEALPPGWDEAEPDEFADLLGSASSSSSKEGGESHAATTN
jgi:hypothetical protein